jgi:hypothetical protein
MIREYESNYSNEVHQLIVSVSRHYFITHKGFLKHQKKALEVNLKNIAESEKTHIVHYMIKDHFSGLFYAEICASNLLIPIVEFLYRAWSRKLYHPLYGIPDFLTVPKNVLIKFPEVKNLQETLGITLVKVTSGFHAGVRDIRTWENELKFCGFDINDPFKTLEDLTVEQVKEKLPEIFERLFENAYGRLARKDIWLSGLNDEKKIYVPKSLEDFIKIQFGTQ